MAAHRTSASLSWSPYQLYTLLKHRKIVVKLVTTDNSNSYLTSDSESRYKKGILDYSSLDFIKKENLTIAEIASTTNGSYALLCDLDIYSHFSQSNIKDNIFILLREAITGKIIDLDMYGNLYYLIGNIPKLLYENNINIDWNRMYNSFEEFLSISKIIHKYETDF